MVNHVKVNLGNRSLHYEDFTQQVSDVHYMLPENQQVFSWMRNALWTCINPHSSMNKTLNELNSGVNDDLEDSVATSPSQLDNNLDLPEETDNSLESSAIELQYGEEWTLFNGYMIDLKI